MKTETQAEKRKSISELHRSRYKRNSISKTNEESRRRRLAIDQALRRKHREQLITAKRFRHLTQKEEYESAGEDDGDYPVNYELNTHDISKLEEELKSSSHEVRLDAVKFLGRALFDPSKAVHDFVVDGDCVNLLTQLLTAGDPDEQLQAVVGITNIAAGSYEFCIKATSTIPYLVSYLKESNVALQDHSAWALGNMAVESDEIRSMLRKNGVLQPLVNLLDSSDSNLVQTACFALSNLARGPNAHLEEFFQAGISPKLASHLINNTPDTVTEICWVLSYLTAGSDQFIGQLLNEGIAPLLVQNMEPLHSQGALALPLIRTFGNIASGPDDYTDILIKEQIFLPGIISFCQSDCRPVKKESLWVLSNITASRRPEVLEKVIQAGAIPILTEIASHTNFDIRKEAAFSLTNIACHGTKYIQALPNNVLLPGYLEFVRSEDPELIKLGLTYLQLLLTHVPEGKSLMQSIPDSIYALESVTLSTHSDLCRTASVLMDTYFGENNEGVEQDILA
ncbi:hypothetical protein K450DRAFT_253707 [Umbelopsis ramanniana AG]|uniref:Importin subunit alpha n=1 Tax=Umbelopsis ramanniana AG TaxID=1314678 RepID=A0AAD5E3Y4_UMBRA|nr:uncharacterized protein K450DRAFT_253707 [Umbelopsis ramanniana AG]KAI8577108.1 hypothetical protein K450DRAFT_253707 [Umbelopsis ramanniana AG]